MMKKFAAMLLTGVIAFSLAACGGSTGATTSTDTAAEETAEAETEATAEADAAAATDDDTTFVVGFDAGKARSGNSSHIRLKRYRSVGVADNSTGYCHSSSMDVAASSYI